MGGVRDLVVERGSHVIFGVWFLFVWLRAETYHDPLAVEVGDGLVCGGGHGGLVVVGGL